MQQEGSEVHLEQVVLHDIADDAKFVKVAAAAVGAKGLLEADLHVGDEVAVPRRRQELVCESARTPQSASEIFLTGEDSMKSHPLTSPRPIGTLKWWRDTWQYRCIALRSFHS